jgi:hypothetical protein
MRWSEAGTACAGFSMERILVAADFRRIGGIPKLAQRWTR